MAVPARSGASVTSIVKEMAAALADEIAATRKRRSGWRPIGMGIRFESGAMGTLYEFAAACGGSARPGRSVELRLGGRTFCCTVVGTTENAIRLRVPQDLGPEIGPACMRQDAAWILLEQRSQLLALGSRPPGLSALLLCPAGARTGLRFSNETLGRVTTGLNSDQSAAVTKALDGELSYLWGPPGTGKTLTLARIAEAFYREGLSLLVAAPTNQAVDHLLLGVLERLEGDEAVAEHAVLRLGPIVSGDLDRHWGDVVDPDRVAAREAGAAHTATQMGAMTDALERLDREEADPDEAATVARLRAILTEDLCGLKARRAAVWPAIEARRESLVESARLVATTLHRACLPGQLQRDFDVLIVDEANAAQFPTVFLAAARTRERLVIAGDFRQLPPVVLSRTDEARMWLGRDAFQVGGVARATRREPFHPRLTMLRTQYRMAPAICDLVGDFAYGGQLTTAAARLKAPRSSAGGGLLAAGSLALIDTSSMAVLLDHRRGKERALTRPLRSNPWHRLVIGRVLRELFASGQAGGPRPTVAVLTPYRDQLRLLRDAFGERYAVSILTVHQALGREWDVVILDLPEAEGLRPSPFMSASQLSHTGARLLTVGLSRARERLVVVADCAYYRRNGLGHAVVGRLLAEMEARHTWVPVRRLVRVPSGGAPNRRKPYENSA